MKAGLYNDNISVPLRKYTVERRVNKSLRYAGVEIDIDTFMNRD